MKKNKDVDYVISAFRENFSDEYFNSVVSFEKIIILGKENNGYITTKEVTKQHINREYIRLLTKNGVLERVERGIYILRGTIPDDFYIFQLRYPKTIFSHTTALYFHNLTEIFPSKFDITCSRSYNVKNIKDNNLFYVDNKFLDLGRIKIKTKFGNVVYTYDIERTICDLIRCNSRMDEENFIKSIKRIVESGMVDMNKLSLYSKKLKCHDKVIKVVRYYDT